MLSQETPNGRVGPRVYIPPGGHKCLTRGDLVKRSNARGESFIVHFGYRGMSYLWAGNQCADDRLSSMVVIPGEAWISSTVVVTLVHNMDALQKIELA